MTHAPKRQGLYDPAFEHDACGVGFVAHIKGQKSRDIVTQALQVLINLRHRGAEGSDKSVGDGAGILLQLPHALLARASHALGFELPDPGQYGVAMIFSPAARSAWRPVRRTFEQLLSSEHLDLIGWRQVPTINADLGQAARDSEPRIMQAFVARPPGLSDLDFERRLYVLRRLAEKRITTHPFYICSLSHRTIVYKGMLKAEQLGEYFPDLAHPATISALAVVHSRFSTNTFPSWERAHPYRYVSHNGEINTLRGNVNWMHTRQSQLRSPLYGESLQKLFPVIDPTGSDSAMLDNVLEFLTLSGRTMAHAMMMMVPEPHEHHASMDPDKRAFYEFHACLMEPWDGPAAIVFTDGQQLGACLDRNGLRPARYYLTQDDRVILASEVGVADIPPAQIRHKGRLQPGRMLLVDTHQGRIIGDDELKSTIATAAPYRRWLQEGEIHLRELPFSTKDVRAEETPLSIRQRAFGMTHEEQRLLLTPMAQTGKEPIGSMGNDTPLAVLSHAPKPLFDYFKQRFAQVTNPPIDAIREAIVTATRMSLGPEHNLLDPGPKSCRLFRLPHPILTCEELARLRRADSKGLRTATLPMLWDPSEGQNRLQDALDDLFDRADQAIDNGAAILILSDRGVTAGRAPIPSLLATAGLHHYLIDGQRRTQVGLVIETAEARQVHHMACLLGYGAAAINPYLALETVQHTADAPDCAVKNLVGALVQGVLKVISKMGISTFQSYCGAEIFEALGLSEALVGRYFGQTPTRIGGLDLAEVAQEVRRRHQAAFPTLQGSPDVLPSGGEYQWRYGGEAHLLGPKAVHLLQRACRSNDYEGFREYTALTDQQTAARCTLRSLFELRSNRQPIPITEVEPISAIVQRFKTGAMSYGSISAEAHEALAVAMNRLGAKSNSGEGGEDPARFVPLPGGDSKKSAIKQVASGRFGVTLQYLASATEIQIKMAQGAKPGEGGHLPGHKVYPWIAKVRHSTPGVGLISPPPHHDIYSIEDLAQLIFDLKNANPSAKITVKLVSTVGVGTIAAGVAKAHADTILISGYDGGTGAAPLTSIKHAGIPWELGLSETHQTLLLNDLRSRVRLETDGQLRTGRDVVVAAMLGAEEFGFATAPLVVLGCVYMRACHLNTCPVGVATQDPELRRRFTGDPAHVVTLMRFIAQEVRETMARLGFHSFDQLVGRADLLRTGAQLPQGSALPQDLAAPQRPAETARWKTRGLDLSRIVYRPQVPPGVDCFQVIDQDHGLDRSLDRQLLLDLCAPAIERGEAVRASLPIKNTNRVVGTQVAHAIVSRHGSDGLPEDLIRLHFEGSAGQSFGAFAAPGMTLLLEGDANDFVGKGLSGGRLVIFPPRQSSFEAHTNVIIGNVALYGATAGEAFVSGIAGERFAVRNSGADAVVEAVGDHGCEYMTGGRVVVLGPIGRNFAAGMSGGLAYLFDPTGALASMVNPELVDVIPVDDATERAAVRALIATHARHTGSKAAERILAEWETRQAALRCVLPRDYARALAAKKEVPWAS